MMGKSDGWESHAEQLVSAVLRYGGSQARTTNLFSNKNIFEIARSSIARGLQVSYSMPL
jgi:hypothetical protein